MWTAVQLQLVGRGARRREGRSRESRWREGEVGSWCQAEGGREEGVEAEGVGRRELVPGGGREGVGSPGGAGRSKF